MTAFDEMDTGAVGSPVGVRAPYQDYKRWLDAAPADVRPRTSGGLDKCRPGLLDSAPPVQC